MWVQSLVGKIPGRRAWQPAPLLLLVHGVTVSLTWLSDWVCMQWEQQREYLGRKLGTRWWGDSHNFPFIQKCFIWFGLVCIPFADILIRTLSTKGKYFETWLLNKCHTLIFLEFISTANSHHDFYASHSVDFFRELNLKTSLCIYCSLQTTSFPLHLHNYLNSHFSDFFVQVTAMTLDRSLALPHSTCT